MPVYEYRCKSCNRTHEIEHGFNDVRPTTCPTCGGPLVRVFHPVGLVFKGSGFHKTDYAGSGVKPEAETKGADTKPGEAKTEGKTEAKPAQTKPASDAGKSSDAKGTGT
jgi:putative FmdB family regulatory protein